MPLFQVHIRYLKTHNVRTVALRDFLKMLIRQNKTRQCPFNIESSRGPLRGVSAHHCWQGQGSWWGLKARHQTMTSCGQPFLFMGHQCGAPWVFTISMHGHPYAAVTAFQIRWHMVGFSDGKWPLRERSECLSIGTQSPFRIPGFVILTLR